MNKGNIQIDENDESQIIFQVENVPVHYKYVDMDDFDIHDYYIKEIKRNERIIDLLHHYKYEDMWLFHQYNDESRNFTMKSPGRWHYVYRPPSFSIKIPENF
ncbi:hypothetical protein MXB_5239 [Myxobolus squamalis]|nr:hypothetical protein MXB_5239 [Myxobolus squamalis]